MANMESQDRTRSRERSDKISSIMGQYLLQGYRMLGSCCDKCGTVLLKFRDQPEYCIGCREVDVVIISSQQEASQPVTEPLKVTPSIPTEQEFPRQQEETHSPEYITLKSETLSTAITSLNEKILWASSALVNCTSIEESIRYCELLKSCAEAIKALREADRIDTNPVGI